MKRTLKTFQHEQPQIIVSRPGGPPCPCCGRPMQILATGRNARSMSYQQVQILSVLAAALGIVFLAGLAALALA